MVTTTLKWQTVVKWLLLLVILAINQVSAQTFPPAGVDNTSSLGKFSL
jgi:hypothetical protein